MAGWNAGHERKELFTHYRLEVLLTICKIYRNKKTRFRPDCVILLNEIEGFYALSRNLRAYSTKGKAKSRGVVNTD